MCVCVFMFLDPVIDRLCRFNLFFRWSGVGSDGSFDGCSSTYKRVAYHPIRANAQEVVIERDKMKMFGRAKQFSSDVKMSTEICNT